MSKSITIELIKERNKKEATKDSDEDEESDEPDHKIKVKIEKPFPEGVKLSKKNTCIVTILQTERELNEAISEEKLL